MKTTASRTTHTVLPLAAALLLPASAIAAPYTLFGKTLDTDWATTTAEITGGGYSTDLNPPNDVALPSDTSPDWDVGDSLGTFFQRPPFQPGYSATTPVTGAPGTAATLGQDPGFPVTPSTRDFIRLTWGAGFGVTDVSGEDDLGIFEQATSEAFAVSVHVSDSSNSGELGWSDWLYVPYEPDTYDSANDTTPTWIDLSGDLGLATGVVINAIEVANLIATDTVATEIASTGLGLGVVDFSGASGFAPGRWSGSQSAWVGFEAGKYDPDIQYVTALRTLTSGVSGSISAVDLGPSAPLRPPPVGSETPVPVPGVAALLLPGLALLLGGRRRPSPGLAKRDARRGRRFSPARAWPTVNAH